MSRIFTYYDRYSTFRVRWRGLPSWARFLVLVAALPGLVLAGLSLLVLCVSLLALLLLCAPVYAVLRGLTAVAEPVAVGRGGEELIEGEVVRGPVSAEGPPAAPASVEEAPSGPRVRRQVDVKIIE
jgi:hypothetical protein